MPMVIPIITAVAAAVSAASGIMGMVDRPGTPKVPDPTKQPLTAAQNKQEQAAVGQALPDLQSMTGGSLSPEYAAQFGALQSGLANDPKATGNVQAAINQFFGLAAPGKTGFTPEAAASSETPFTDFLKKIMPQLSGQQPQGGSDWVSQTLQNQDFKGLAG